MEIGEELEPFGEYKGIKYKGVADLASDTPSRRHALQPILLIALSKSRGGRSSLRSNCSAMSHSGENYDSDVASPDHHFFHFARTARVRSPCVRAYPALYVTRE